MFNHAIHAGIKDIGGCIAAVVARQWGNLALADYVDQFQPRPRGELAISFCTRYRYSQYRYLCSIIMVTIRLDKFWFVLCWQGKSPCKYSNIAHLLYKYTLQGIAARGILCIHKPDPEIGWPIHRTKLCLRLSKL